MHHLLRALPTFALLLAPLAACSSTASPDAAADTTDAIADIASDADPDALAHCYEIFPTPARYADGGSVPGSGVAMAHANPLAFELGAVPVGATVTASVRYYNFCGDPAAAVIGTDTDPASESSSFTVMPPANGPIGMQVSWSVAFHPATAGEHRMTVRVRTNGGVYQTELHGTGE